MSPQGHLRPSRPTAADSGSCLLDRNLQVLMRLPPWSSHTLQGRRMQTTWQSKRAIEVRRALAGGACFAVALCIGTSAAPAYASDLALIANVCWEYKHFIETKLDASHLICFQRGAWATGVSFHGHDGWDWSVRYKIVNRIIFLDGETWRSVLSVDQHRMILADGDEQRTYRYVCRTKAESIQCERLHYRLSRSASPLGFPRADGVRR